MESKTWSAETINHLSRVRDEIKECDSIWNAIGVLYENLGFECGKHLEQLLAEEIEIGIEGYKEHLEGAKQRE